ncbi:aldehyde dehydrogenase (NAD+) [Geomicrobium halophilum]|uniref:Aldehyde dehydrogenase n=1 Tax=Geomicrobium halophilum TaxID=549000 RepID=A0A841PRE7_9BACL|nr:aldehyde dehydrogenase [Geomicrobium halophilum]MBB6451349.1 aldehyde dehydrogenase (NAD+) [Geomicrobium halophilum]
MKEDVNTVEDVQTILSEHRQFFLTESTRDVSFRIKQLNQLKKAIQDHEAEISAALEEDLGKSTFEAYVTEIGIVLNSISDAIKHLKTWDKPVKVKTPAYMQPSKSYIVNEPYGTVLIIGPFNYPFQLLMEPLIGAIAAGNCAVLKASEHTPATARVVKGMLAKIFYKEYIRVVEGGVDTNTALIHSRFDYIFFTGSPRVGKIVMEAAAKNLIPVTLELGGKSPAVVHKDANLKKAAERITWGKFLNAGQTCIAPDHVMIHADVKEKFMKLLKKKIEKFYGSDIQHNDDYGRIINQGHFDRLTGIIEKDHDALVYGGGHDHSDHYIEPTILDISSREAASMQEEIFGPILPVLTFADINTAIADINGQPKPLAFYLFTENEKLQETIMERASYGGGCVNDTIMHVGNPHLPFGGVGSSGMGVYHGYYSYQTFSHQKSVMNKSTKVSTSFMYPPYKNKLKLVKKFLK